MKNMGNKPQYDLVGLGNAIVDVLSFCDEAFIAQEKLTRGGMALVDETRAEQLYGQVKQGTECSGGSVANTLAGMASLGAKCAFVGKVAPDQLGAIFTHDMRAVGVHFNTPPAKGETTAVCLVFVTPDAQRTMATYLGACTLLAEADIDETLIADAGIVYVEGYLWHGDNAKAAIRKAIAAAHKAGRKVAFTLSDTFCVEGHREEFLQMIGRDIDILFANESELKSLYQTEDFDAALQKLRGVCSIAAITRSEKGSVVLSKDGVEVVPAEKVSKIVDTTGAGDLYASGFLYGLTRGWDLRACAALGNRCAAEIIAQLGARSMKPLKELVA